MVDPWWDSCSDCDLPHLQIGQFKQGQQNDLNPYKQVQLWYWCIRLREKTKKRREWERLFIPPLSWGHTCLIGMATDLPSITSSRNVVPSGVTRVAINMAATTICVKGELLVNLFKGSTLKNWRHEAPQENLETAVNCQACLESPTTSSRSALSPNTSCSTADEQASRVNVRPPFSF